MKCVIFLSITSADFGIVTNDITICSVALFGIYSHSALAKPSELLQLSAGCAVLHILHFCQEFRTHTDGNCFLEQ